MSVGASFGAGVGVTMRVGGGSEFVTTTREGLVVRTSEACEKAVAEAADKTTRARLKLFIISPDCRKRTRVNSRGSL
jgi:hypothetical protein